MTDSYKIIISCGGKSFEISPESSAHLIEGGLHGFDAAPFDVTVCPYASQSGGYAQKRRFSERKEYRFYRCPVCKKELRVPRGKGKIRIKCPCGNAFTKRT